MPATRPFETRCDCKRLADTQAAFWSGRFETTRIWHICRAVAWCPFIILLISLCLFVCLFELFCWPMESFEMAPSPSQEPLRAVQGGRDLSNWGHGGGGLQNHTQTYKRHNRHYPDKSIVCSCGLIMICHCTVSSVMLGRLFWSVRMQGRHVSHLHIEHCRFYQS